MESSKYETTFKIPLTKSLNLRTEKHRQSRRSCRNSLFDRSRIIAEEVAEAVAVVVPVKPAPVKNLVQERLDRLKKFKEQKKIRLELEHKNKKPPFKFSAQSNPISSTDAPKYTNKTYAYVQKKVDTGRVTRSMARRDNIPLTQGVNVGLQKKKFVPPKNVKSIDIPKVPEPKKQPVNIKNVFGKVAKPEMKNQHIFTNISNSLTIKTYPTEADQFEIKLDKEIKQLQSQCEEWEQIKQQDQSIPGDIVDDIDTAIGQTNLLISKKFEQFRGLINQCRRNQPDQKVTAEDLQGFWDMIYMQVDNINNRFSNLRKKQVANWKVSEEKPILKSSKKVVAKPMVKPAATNVKSNLKLYIEELKKKKMKERAYNDEIKILDNSIACFEPKENVPLPITPMRCREGIKKINTPIASPGLKMMRASILGKIMSPTESIN